MKKSLLQTVKLALTKLVIYKYSNFYSLLWPYEGLMGPDGWSKLDINNAILSAGVHYDSNIRNTVEFWSCLWLLWKCGQPFDMFLFLCEL